MQKRVALFFLLSATILIGWQYVMQAYFVTKPPQGPNSQPVPTPPQSPIPAPTITPTAQSPAPPAVSAPPVEQRLIKLKTPFWEGTLSNQGGVLTQWTMKRFNDRDRTEIDPPNGVNLVSSKTSQEIGAPLRFFIPSDRDLEKELNEARYAIDNAPESEISLQSGEREIALTYSNNGVTARKKWRFNGAGYDFDIQAEVMRNGQPVEAYLAVGPNFGDQSITEYGYYKPAPQVSYAAGSSVHREVASSVKGNDPHPIQAERIRWAAIDDNYFAMALVPPNPTSNISLLNHRRREKVNGKEVDRDHISVAIPVANGQINRVYAGPKDPETLKAVSQKFGLGAADGNLEDLVNYGFLAFMVKPLAQLMLKALIITNSLVHNYGWSIVILTIILNMFFFPLRWKSSVSMKRTAAMQPKMKELQEKMKKLDKNDPRMVELQREQIAMMREGNPLMGCLPLLLQMPFFYAVFTILTISIEVRHAHFFGWITDLSSPDRYWILPIVMCISMLVQQALTPSTADPVQKKVGYLMPLLFTGMFFIYAPAGLVLYWMVGNLVGIAQQYVINKMSPPAPPPATEKKTDRLKQQHPRRKKSKELVTTP
jgi:YidC/Oxa1 family membrane protein insertase